MADIDLLIVGSGISALSAAVSAKEQGASISIATKSIPTKNNSVMAQGGINAALGNVEDDSIELHIQDTLKAAHNIASPPMVSKLCTQAIDAAAFLERIGVAFSRIEGASEPLKSIAQRKLGGASAKRACYAQDYTGLKILNTLLERAIFLDIPLHQGLFLLELIKNENRVCGGLFFNFNSGKIETIYAKRVLIATGGFGGIYANNTNSSGSSGDALAVTLRAGGVLSNLEFVQFHPTTLKGSNILISESARGEGGYLVDEKGERFIDELAPRDEIAKAIFQKMQHGHQIFLDLRHLGKEKLERQMPQELKLIRQYANTDASTHPIAIEPAVHYTMGGASVQENFEIEGLKGCFCVGEASNSHVHGSNRLGGNSLLEAVAFGMLGANEALASNTYSSVQTPATYTLPLNSSSDNFAILKAKKALSLELAQNVGIIREQQSLEAALQNIENLHIEDLTLSGPNLQYSTLLLELLELKNANLLAYALIKSALWRKESRGSHTRSDYPNSDAAFEKESQVTLENKEVVVYGA